MLLRCRKNLLPAAYGFQLLVMPIGTDSAQLDVALEVS